MSLTPEILAQLEARHLAFLDARLVSPAAEAEWRAALAAGWADLQKTPVRALVSAPALAAALAAVLTPEAIERAARPLGAKILPLVLRELAAEKGKLGDHVPAATRARIEALLARPTSTPDRVLRELAEQEAIQSVLRDVLFDGLKEFSEKVNPFIADWGVPSLLKRAGFLAGPMIKGLDSVRAELDKRVEPEIQRFLGGFTKKGLRRMVDVGVSRSGDPTAAALRKHMLAWVLDQELAVLMRETGEESVALAQEIVMDLVGADFGRDRAAQRRRLIDEIVAAAGERTVGEALAALGVTFTPDLAAVADATWPLVKAAVGLPSVKGWMKRVVGEFYEAEMNALG